MVEKVCLTEGLLQGGRNGATSSRFAHRVGLLIAVAGHYLRLTGGFEPELRALLCLTDACWRPRPVQTRALETTIVFPVREDVSDLDEMRSTRAGRLPWLRSTWSGSCNGWSCAGSVWMEDALVPLGDVGTSLLVSDVSWVAVGSPAWSSPWANLSGACTSYCSFATWRHLKQKGSSWQVAGPNLLGS